MASGFKAAFEVQCWKEHTCCYCGNIYRYRFTRKKAGLAATEAAARDAANRKVIRALCHESDWRPCPDCGHYQPDMVGAVRFARHGWLLWLTFCLFVGLYSLSLTQVVPDHLALYLLTSWAALILFGNALIVLAQPNRNLQTNKAIARRLIDEGALESAVIDQVEKRKPRPGSLGPGMGFWFALLLLLTASLLIPTAELVRLGAGWSLNPDWHPAVVGPGDRAWIELPHSIESLDGQWLANSAVGKILNGNELFLPGDAVTITSRDQDWHEDLGTTHGEDTKRAVLWARVHVPHTARLSNKTIRVQIDLDVKYPVWDPEQNARLKERDEAFTHTAELTLGSPRAGLLYAVLWHVGILGGGTMFLLGGGYFLCAAGALRAFGSATRVVPIV